MKVKKIIFFNVIILVSFILFIEIFARLFNLADLTGISKNLIINQNKLNFNAPNIKAIAFSKKVYTDKSGFRIPNENFKYDLKNSSVLILGDSVSFGVGVDESDSFVGLLRNKFNNINFYNSSVSGYSFKDYPHILKKNNNINKLNQTILFFTLNDISFEKTVLNIDEEFKKYKSNTFLIKLNIFLRNKSVFYMWLKGIVTNPSVRHFNYIYPIYNEEDAILKLKIEINKLKNSIDEKNNNLTFIILPYEFQTRKENCNEKYLKPQSELKNILKEENINFFDYSKNFCIHKNPKSLFLKFDPVHLSKDGHYLVFNLIKNDLEY